MMKKICSLFILSLLLFQCADAKKKQTVKEINISGHVKFTETDTDFGLILSSVGADYSKKVIKRIAVDSLSNYNFKLRTDSIGFYEIDVYKTNRITFYADDEDLTIDFRGIDTAKVKIKNPPYIHITGGPKNNVLNMINFEKYQNYQGMIAVGQQQYKSSLSNSEEWKAHAASLWGPLYNDTDDRIRHIIKTFIEYPTTIKAIDMLSWKRDKDLMMESYGYLAKKYPNLDFVVQREQDLKDKIANDLRMSVGNVAPDFTFPDIDGNNVTLSDFRGKYVLIDFWASWCGPCRKESPHVQKVYQKYSSDLELVTVSIDAKIDDWKRAVKEDAMDGQLLIAQNSKNIQKLYIFSGIPYMVLLDREGKIVGKNLRGKSLDNKLAEIFGNN